MGLTARELLELYDRHGPFFSDAGLERLEAAQVADRPPDDKGATY